jgi:uncharacterized protein YqeY
MTAIRERINDDLKKAMKGGDSFTVIVLRTINAALHNKTIEKRGRGGGETLTDEEIVEVLSREVKKRREAAALYRQGNRVELAEKEEKEIVIVSGYLPEQLDEAGIEKIVDEVMAGLKQTQGGVALSDVMKALMPKLKGRADSRLVTEIVKKRLP